MMHSTKMKVATIYYESCQIQNGERMQVQSEDLYLIAGIAPPSIQRDVCARMEKIKHKTNDAYSLYGQHPAERSLKCRNWELLLA